MANKIHVLQAGYSKIQQNVDLSQYPAAIANCSCVLITGKANVVVDTMTPWDKDFILAALKSKGLDPDDVQYVVSTHGHSDHVGNNNLFLKAKHIMGYSVSFKDKYFSHPFDQGVPYSIADGIEVIPTPGHTIDDVSVVVHTDDLGVVVVAGDIFEREEDILKPEIWRSEGGSADPEKQESSRRKILQLANYIVPGHGPMFKVTEEMKLHS